MRQMNFGLNNQHTLTITHAQMHTRSVTYGIHVEKQFGAELLNNARLVLKENHIYKMIVFMRN